MKVSEITYNEVVEYLRLSVENIDESEKKQIELYLNIAKNYIENYTGIPQKDKSEESEKSLDDYEDLVIVVLILCQDMYDNRAMYIDNNNINKTVQTILDMHVRNNL